MATALTTAIKFVRQLIDEPTAAFWSNTELTQWINEACKDIARRAETKQTTVLITGVLTQQDYTMPADTYRVHRVEFHPTEVPRTTLFYTLEYRGMMEMDQIWGINKTWPASYPLYYTLWKNPPALKMIVYPVPQTAGKFQIYYYQQVTEATGTSDDIDVLPGYEDLVYDYAAYRALRKDSNPMWKTHQLIYEEKLLQMVNRTRTYQDQGNFFSTGQVALPAWLITDDMGS